MDLKDISDDDQTTEKFRVYYKRFVLQYQTLRELGAPEELAIALTVDWHRITWEQYYKDEDKT